MTWAKLDDGIYDHPKVIQAGRDARELFFASIVYCSRHLTDGVMPHGALRILQAWTEIDDAEASAKQLLHVGLWEMSGADYLIHDYLKYQPTREEVERTRDARAEAGRKGGKRSGEVRTAQAHEAKEAKGEAFASQLLEAKPKQKRTPSRPVPSTSLVSLSSDIPSDYVCGVTPTDGASAPQPRTPTPSQPRKRDEHWDALVAIFGYEPATAQEKGRWGKVVHDLKVSHATPDDIRRAKANYDAALACGAINWTLTPMALAAHLGELLNDPAQSYKPGGNGGNGHAKDHQLRGFTTGADRGHASGVDGDGLDKWQRYALEHPATSH